MKLFHAAKNGDQSRLHGAAAAVEGDADASRSPRMPTGFRSAYFALAAVGIFSLLVGASVRLRRPEHQATLHFFWLCIAFFGVLAFSFSGRLDTLDWVFYWADVVAMLLLPPLFLHFALVFPERPDSLGAQRRGPHAAAAALPAGAAARRRRASRRRSAIGRGRRRALRPSSGWSSAASCCIWRSASSAASGS